MQFLIHVNIKKGGNMNKASNYWLERPLGNAFACPNVSLFRLIGSFLPSLEGLNCLEIGFGHGADLVECASRGGKIFGLDLNPIYVNNMYSKTGSPTETFYAGKDRIPFEPQFDLIYSRDTIYYITDNEISFFLKDCYLKLKKSSYLIVQFLEKDYVLNNAEKSNCSEFETGFLKNYSEKNHFEPDNPIRLLNPSSLIKLGADAQLECAGSKLQIETYGSDLEKLRVNRYLVFQKIR